MNYNELKNIRDEIIKKYFLTYQEKGFIVNEPLPLEDKEDITIDFTTCTICTAKENIRKNLYGSDYIMIQPAMRNTHIDTIGNIKEKTIFLSYFTMMGGFKYYKNISNYENDFNDIVVSEFDFLHNYFDKITEEYAETVLSFYKTINHINTDSNKVEFIDEKCFIKNNPLNFKYFNVIWKMFTKIDQPYLMKEFFKIFSLRLFTPKERYEIWQIILKKIFDEQDKFVQPIIALNMINYIINISEKYGTGGVVPHFLENIKKIPIKLRITSKIPPFPDFELTENIYTTSNLYDVKKEIQKKFCIDPILISFSEHEKDYYPYHDSDTGSYNQ